MAAAVTSSQDTINSSSAFIVSWTDRWLGCMMDGQKSFQRRWVSLTDDMLHISYDPTDVAGPLASYTLRDIELDCDEGKFWIQVECGEDGCVFRCGESLEFAATWAALQRVTQIAKSKCLMCAALQRELDQLAKERDLNAANLLQMAAVTERNGELMEQLQRCEATAAELQRALDEARDKCSAVDKRRLVAEARATAAEKSERELKAQIKQALEDATTAQQRAQFLADEKTALQVALQTSAQDQSALTAHVASLRASLLESEALLQAQRTNLDELTSQLARADSEARHSRQAISALEEAIATERSASAEVHKRLCDAREEVGTRDAVQAQLQTEVKRLDGRINDLLAEQAQLQGSRESLSQALQQATEKERAAVDRETRARQDFSRQQAEAAHQHREEVEALQRDANAAKESAHALQLELEGALSRAAAAESDFSQAKLSWQAERDGTAELIAEARARRRLEFADASTETTAFSDCVAASPEFQRMISERVTRERHVDRCIVVARLADGLASLSDVAVVELEGIISLLRDIPNQQSDATDLLGSSALTSPNRSSPSRQRGPTLGFDSTRPSARLLEAIHACSEIVYPGVAATGGAVGVTDWASVAQRLLHDLQCTVNDLAAQHNLPDSPMNRAIVVAREAGFLDAIAELDAATALISELPRARDAIMEHLRGPGSHARGLASSILSGPRALRNAAVESICQAVDTAFCGLFDKCVKSAARRGPGDANWLRNVARTTSQCRTASQKIRSSEGAAASEALLDEWLREASQLAESTKSLQHSEFARPHTAELHDALAASLELQYLVFAAFRRMTRAWLRHHLCAESIARFGLQLKRAGTMLAKTRGFEQIAEDCLTAWPIVKHLTELPRRILDEDRAFQVMWDAVTDQLKATAVSNA